MKNWSADFVKFRQNEASCLIWFCSSHVTLVRSNSSFNVEMVCHCFKSAFHPQEETEGEVASNPPESSFQKLAPSETRYTILSRGRDELWPQRPSSDPVTQCHAPGSGRGLGLGQASGTEQQHPTPLLKREREMRRRRRRKKRMKTKEEKKKNGRRRADERSPWHNHVGITYIFITLSRTIFILD